MTWYEQWFNRDEYDLLYQNRNDEEAARLIDLIQKETALPASTRVLDIGCGRGRHSLIFAERGYRVTGLDLSEKAIEIARERRDAAGLDVEFILGDMRETVEENGFELVVNLFTAFGYFDDPDEHEQAIAAMIASLKPGGWFVQDFLNARYVRDTHVALDEREVEGIRITQQRRIVDNRIRKKITFEKEGSSHSFEESVALLVLEDFERMYAKIGLEIMFLAGEYDGRALSDESSRLILFSQKSL